jgi:hypothetical protein
MQSSIFWCQVFLSEVFILFRNKQKLVALQVLGKSLGKLTDQLSPGPGWLSFTIDVNRLI